MALFDFNSCVSEVAVNLNIDEKIISAIKYNINQQFKKNLYFNIVWHFFHCFSVNYEPVTTNQQKTEIYYFMNNVKKSVSGCSSCLADDSHFIINNMEEIISSKENMVEWFVNLHNIVNIKKNEKSGTSYYRTDWTAQEVIDKYQTTDYTSFLFERYNLDLNNLPVFYDELVKVRNTINSDNTKYVNFNITTLKI
jgi:hypothetical protein